MDTSSMNMYGLVYLAWCKVNGKRYVGQTTTSLHHRRMSHLGDARRNNKDCCAFAKALRKHGEESFEWSILQWCFTPKTLNEAERFWIDSLHSRIDQQGYNIFVGGDNPLPEDIARRSESIRAYYRNGGKAWNCGISPSEKTEQKRRDHFRLHPRRNTSETIERMRSKAIERYRDSSQKLFGKSNPNYRNGNAVGEKQYGPSLHPSS